MNEDYIYRIFSVLPGQRQANVGEAETLDEALEIVRERFDETKEGADLVLKIERCPAVDVSDIRPAAE